MRVLSIKNPLSYMVAAGIKREENRTWTTKYRGRLLIHSCGEQNCHCLIDADYPAQVLAWRDAGINNEITKAMDKFAMILDRHYGCASADAWYALMDDPVRLKEHKPYMRPLAIIGEVTLSDIVRDSSDPFAEPDMYHWILTEPRLYDYNEVIYPVRGKLGLWEFSQEVPHG